MKLQILCSVFVTVKVFELITKSSDMVFEHSSKYPLAHVGPTYVFTFFLIRENVILDNHGLRHVPYTLMYVTNLMCLTNNCLQLKHAYTKAKVLLGFTSSLYQNHSHLRRFPPFSLQLVQMIELENKDYTTESPKRLERVEILNLQKINIISIRSICILVK